MASQEEIDHQQNLLAINRRNLAHYLQQRDTLGEPYTPPGILNGIVETRANIGRIKGILSDWHAPVEDHPDDGERPAPETPAAGRAPAPAGGVTVNIHGGSFSGPVAQTGGSNVSSIFNQPNWKVEGNVYNIARDLNMSAQPDKNELLAALRQLQGELSKAEDLPADQADDLKDNLDAAIKAVDRPQPNKDRTVEKLTTMQKILDGLKGNIGSALALGNLIGQVLLAAQNIHF